MEGKKKVVQLTEVCDENTLINPDSIQERDHGASTKLSNLLQKFPKRYAVALMAFFGFCNIYALRVNISVAIVTMTSNRTREINGEMETFLPDFDWNSHMRGLVLGSFFFGYILTQFLGGYLATRFSGKLLFGGGVFATAVLTLLTPLCATWSVYALITLRIMEGLFEGVTYPAMHEMWSKWAPPAERTRLTTIAFSGSYAGTMLTLPIAGALCNSSAGWPSTFYVFGAVAIVWVLFWWFLISETPAQHKTISNGELEMIQRSIGYTDEQAKRMSPPWLSILKSLPVYAIICAHFAENWGFYTWLMELPSFMSDIFAFSIDMASMLAALPYLVMAVVLPLGGLLADVIRRSGRLSTTWVRKIFTCTAFAVQVVFMIAAGYTMNPGAAVACTTIAVGFGGFAWSGFAVNHLDIAPQFAGILFGISNTFATLPGIISPSLTGSIVQNRLPGEWQVVFYIAAGVYLFGGIMFALFASGERQPWAEIPSGYIAYNDDPEDETKQE